MTQRPINRLRSVAFRASWLGLVVLFFGAASAVRVAAAEVESAPAQAVKFNRDVRAILSDKCFFCHGPDAKKRQADLRLDVREVAVNAGAIVPGKPSESLLIERVTSADADEHMPPASAKLEPLTDAEVQTLRRWIEQGAEYENHWSLIPPQPVAAPSGADRANIDSLVADALLKRGVALQPEADRTTLIRRLSFDLTGLPPTPAEVDAFVRDAAPDAYERLVDRLLASPQYGERMAVDWLDASRYADSYGFQVDRPRDAWAWRDWVVRSFNANMPLDQFFTWQLAGDMLPAPTDDQILATAFNRLHQQETEGGSIEEEYRVEYVCDRVQTFATTFLGLTMECARCHDHKYDPIAQRDYYQLFAIFQNIDESGLYSFFTEATPTPVLPLADAPTKERLGALNADVAKIDSELTALRPQRREAFLAWLSRPERLLPESKLAATDDSVSGAVQGSGDAPASAAKPSTDAKPAAEAKSEAETEEMPDAESVPEASSGPKEPRFAGEIGHFTFDKAEKNKLANSVEPKNPAVLRGDNKLVPGKSGNALLLTGDDQVNVPQGAFERHQPFTFSLWMQTPDSKDRAVVFHRTRAWTDAGSRGYELLIIDGCLRWSLIHFWPGNAISIATAEPLPLNKWVHVTVSSDGSSRAEGLRIFVDGRPAATSVVRDSLTKEISGGGVKEITIGERFRDRGFKNGMVDDFRIFDRVLSPFEAFAAYDPAAAEQLGHKDAAALTDDERELLFDYYLATLDDPWRERLIARQTAYGERDKLADGLAEIMVMRELPQPKKAYLLFRGEYGERRDEVQANTPAALPPLPADAPRNRLGLARWLTDRGHPLTARVTVNRIWQSVFGRGLVATAENFGSQGARPLYPEVLDYLALELIDSGWDAKRLLKTIVMSRVYRQRSFSDARQMADDPDNELLARGPRLRLPAEMIRDNALAASRLLDLKLGGPPVNPYEMSESFKPVELKPENEVYRRSLYTNWRRTGPPPAMVAFDAPRRAVCTAKRERTDSPLQALILLNGVQFVEAARVLGESLHLDGKGDVSQMIEQGFLRCLSRRPDNRESEILARLYQEQLAHFDKNTAGAEKLLAIGRAPRDASLTLAQAAAATVLAQTLLNHDECVVKR